MALLARAAGSTARVTEVLLIKSPPTCVRWSKLALLGLLSKTPEAGLKNERPAQPPEAEAYGDHAHLLRTALEILIESPNRGSEFLGSTNPAARCLYLLIFDVYGRTSFLLLVLPNLPKPPRKLSIWRLSLLSGFVL